MAQKQQGRKIYRTAQGKQIDLDLLIKRNELPPAIGNARVNARGDELGPGGQILRSREEVIKDYYNGITPVDDEPVKKTSSDPTDAEIEMMNEFDDEEVVKEQPKKEIEWVEDEKGNFVKKGE